MTPMRFVILIMLFHLLPGISTARAEVYKWVDDRGVVTYSETAPHDREARRIRIDARPHGISVPNLTLATGYGSGDASLRNRVSQLEQDLEAMRQAQRAVEQQAAEAAARKLAQEKLAYERCVADRRVDCDGSREATQWVVRSTPRFRPLPRLPSHASPTIRPAPTQPVSSPRRPPF